MYVKNVHCIKACVLKAHISTEIQKRNHSTWVKNWRNLHEECVGIRIGYIKEQGQSSLRKTIRL